MNAPKLLSEIAAIIGQPLHPAPERDPAHGGQLASLMPFKEGKSKYATNQEGHIIGLNLAFTGLTDAQWENICALLPDQGAKLRALNLSDNQLTNFDLDGLPKVEWLNLSDNQISAFKMPPGQAARMSDINLANNPLGIPIELMAGGRKRVLEYLRETDRTGEEKSLEAKVVLIGEGMSGKTSLRTRLIHGESADLPEEDKRTRGLEVEVLPFYVDLPNNEIMRLNLFDFGGQKHYKPLHQFFYSCRALYVLVTRNGDDSNEFDYWFSTAELFGEKSPVLVVNNLFGDVPSGFSRSKFARFEHIIKDSLDTNLKNCSGFAHVQRRIGQLAEELPHIHQSIPKSWANVRRALEKIRHRNIITLDEYLDLCALEENGAMDEARALNCSLYLHDIGVCLHYPEKDFPGLHRFVIVRNEWATEAVYRVMDDPAVNRQHGRFNYEDLRRIWQTTQEDKEQGENFRYERYVPELLELMRNFKLCYPLKDGKTYVAPSLLPIKLDTDLRWQPDHDLQFEMEYDFMPPALFSRFVVSRYEDIGGQDRDQVWRDEVFFQWENARANVSQPSRAGKNRIVFKVQGKDLESRKLLLTSLLRDLNILHKETPGIKVEERIPCICDGCRESSEPHFFQKSDIDRFKEKGWRTIQCLIHGDPVDVNALLGNIFSTESDISKSTKNRSEKPLKVFISYSELDKQYLTDFKAHLAALRRSNLIEPWDDSKILPGEKWDYEVITALRASSLIILLVSHHFLNTDKIWNEAIVEAMRRHDAGDAIVIPIKIRPCDTVGMPFSHIHGLPRENGSIEGSVNSNDLWLEVINGIRAVIEKFNKLPRNTIEVD